MAIGKIYDSDEITRIQNQLDAINQPFEAESQKKIDLNRKVTIGLYIISGLVALSIVGSFLFKKSKK
jgi:hypothetical protein